VVFLLTLMLPPLPTATPAPQIHIHSNSLPTGLILFCTHLHTRLSPFPLKRTPISTVSPTPTPTPLMQHHVHSRLDSHTDTPTQFPPPPPPQGAGSTSQTWVPTPRVQRHRSTECAGQRSSTCSHSTVSFLRLFLNPLPWFEL
jgi:hypothetical protein